MKSTIITTLAIAAGMALASCTKDNTPAVPEDITFGFSLESVTHNEAQIVITPSDNAQTYYFSVMDKKQYEGYSDEEIFDNDMEGFRKAAEDNGVSIESVISGALYTGETANRATGLRPGTEYVLYSYPLSADGVHGTSLSEFSFSTGEAPAPENSGEVRIEAEEIGSTVCKVRFTPTDPEMMYLSGILPQSDLSDYTGDNPLREYIEDNLQRTADETGIALAEIIQMMMNCGEMASEYHYLIPENDYIAFAARFSSDWSISSVSSGTFTTMEREKIDFTITYDIRDVTQTTFMVDIIVSDPETEYFVECWPKSAISGCSSDEEIMQLALDRYGKDIELHKGDIKDSYMHSLPTDTEFVMVGFGYKETFVTDLFMEEVKTLAQVSPEDLKIEVRIDSKNSIQANAVFLPEDGTVPFHFFFFTEQFLEEECTDIKDAVQKSFDINVDQWQTVYPELSREEIIAQISRKGDRSYIADYLVPETTYYMWAATFTDDGKLVSKEPSYATFTTDKYPLKKEIYTEAVSTKYFDGDVLCKDYGYFLYNGFCVAVVDTVKVSGAKTWYSVFFKGDVSSETEYPEYQLAGNLLLKGMVNKGHEPYDALMKEWGKWTLCSMGVDEDGNYGPIQRTVFDFTREGANNPEEFFDYPNHAPEAPKGKFVEKAAVMRELE